MECKHTQAKNVKYDIFAHMIMTLTHRYYLWYIHIQTWTRYCKDAVISFIKYAKLKFSAQALAQTVNTQANTYMTENITYPHICEW